MKVRHIAAALTLATLTATGVASIDLAARQTAAVPDAMFAPLKWRPVGPMRAGRTCSVSGHRSQPFTFYIGVCNGGVWKTTDAGTTWTPIFDDQPTQSIGAVAVAPSDPVLDVEYRVAGLHRRLEA